MKFLIEFLHDKVPNLCHDEKAAYGRIQIGDFDERFVVCLDFWNVDDYRRQWKQALTRLLHSAKQSCLITSLSDPQKANFITWWPIYQVKGTLHFQNQNLFLNQLRGSFNYRMPYRHVPRRVTVTESGETISEWVLPIDAIRQFFAESRRRRIE